MRRFGSVASCSCVRSTEYHKHVTLPPRRERVYVKYVGHQNASPNVSPDPNASLDCLFFAPQLQLFRYLQLPSVVACGGSWMVAKELVSGGRFEEITALAKEAVAAANA